MVYPRLQAIRSLKSGGLRLSRSCVSPCSRTQAWRVSSCRWSSSQSSSISPKVDKPFYITTPIFYVNAAPHIGHLYTMILSDAIKRWEALKGRTAFLSTGTDEHGAKIQQAAIKEDVDPQQLCDENSEKFFHLLEAGDVSYDRFIRTTEPEHKKTVQQFWKKLKHDAPSSMGLYKGQHAGWYSVSDECFYPENLVEASIEPQTGKRIMVSSETGSEVGWVEEETWFFPLTKYRDALLKFYDENPGWIQPPHRMKEVRNWVANQLEDLSVTRPYQRLNWGVQDPEDSRNTIYVWVDALINYLTVTGYGSKWQTPSDDMGMWPADVQVVGKDIIRFHAVYWPALLLALKLPLPRRIVCHNHWTMSGRKMSKSVGNVVNPFFAVERWGTDALRYFLLRNGNYMKDMDYSNDIILTLYTKDLRGNIGNLFYRVARPKSNTRWSSKEAVESFFNGSFNPDYDQPEPEQGWRCSELEEYIDKAVPAVIEAMDNNDPGEAMAEVFSLMAETNRYVTDTAPWNLSKKKNDEKYAVALHWVIFNCLEALRVTGILLQPIIPTKAKLLLDELRVSNDRRTLTFAKRGADDDYGIDMNDPDATKKISAWETIFPPPSEPNDPMESLPREPTRGQGIKSRKKP